MAVSDGVLQNGYTLFNGIVICSGMEHNVHREERVIWTEKGRERVAAARHVLLSQNQFCDGADLFLGQALTNEQCFGLASKQEGDRHEQNADQDGCDTVNP